MELSARKRTIIGHKVKNLRLKGIIPGSVYGKKVPSQSIEIDLKEFLKTHKLAGDTKLVDLIVEKGESIPVLIHHVQRHPVNDHILNVDLLAVDLKAMIRVSIPVVAKGDAPAITNKIGALINPIREIEVECLPSDLPEKIEIDVSKLENLNDVIKISDIKLGNGIKILTDSNATVFTINELVQKEKIEEVVTPTEVEATAQKKVEEGTTDEAKESGKKDEKPGAPKKEETKKEEKK